MFLLPLYQEQEYSSFRRRYLISREEMWYTITRINDVSVFLLFFSLLSPLMFNYPHLFMSHTPTPHPSPSLFVFIIFLRKCSTIPTSKIKNDICYFFGTYLFDRYPKLNSKSLK